MNSRQWAILKRFSQTAVLFFIWIVIHALSAAPAGAGPAAYRPGEVLVQFKSHSRALHSTLDSKIAGLHQHKTLSNGRLVQFDLPTTLTVAEAVAKLAEDPDVLFAEPNYLISSQAAPDDPFFNLQWGLHNTGQTVSGYLGIPGKDIDALKAWQLVDEDADDVREVLVAVIDTGCALDHPDIVQHLWINENEIPGNLIDDDNNGYVDDVHGWDFVDDDNAPWDASGHGTHVTGIIAAQSNNRLGISGLAAQARIIPIRVMDAFDIGSVADVIAAIDYARSQGARIINCSWGGPGNSMALKNTMAAADALFICAAGNAGGTMMSMDSIRPAITWTMFWPSLRPTRWIDWPGFPISAIRPWT